MNGLIDKKKVVGIFIGLMTSLLLYALDTTVVSTAMKQIIGELHGMQYYAWPFTAYMLGSTIIIPICGEISDVYGDKPVFLAGIFVFLFVSVFCGW
jgi:MFS family permease